MKALGTSIATVKPRLLKKRAIESTAIRQAVPNPSIGKTPIKHSEFQLVIGQKGGEHLNEVHVQLFFETVGDAMLDLISCSTFIPAFESCKIRKGKIIITAKNGASRDWLLRHLGKIRPNGAELVVAGQAESPSPVIYKTGFIWVPTARYNNAEIMQILESQNPELMVSSWKVLERQPEPWGLTLKVDIDSKCISALEDINFQPYFVLRRLDVKLLQNLKRKITSDPNTDIIGPTQIKKMKQQISTVSDGRNAKKLIASASRRKPPKTVRRRIEASKIKSAEGTPKCKKGPPSTSRRHFSLTRRSGSPIRSKMSYNCNQQTGRIPSLLDINAPMPNFSQMRAPLFHNLTMDKESTFDAGGHAVWNNTITSRELDAALNSSFCPAERDNFPVRVLAYERNKSFSSRSLDSARNRGESYIGRQFLIENEPILQRSTFSPPITSYQEINSLLPVASDPVPKLGSSSLICYPNPTNNSGSGLSFKSSLTEFSPDIESRTGSGYQQQFSSIRSRREPNTPRNMSGFSRSLNQFHHPKTSEIPAMRQRKQRSKKFK
nr:unnamed protein product [Callosobruchus chinensis]